MKSLTRFKIIWIVIWALSCFALVTGLIFIWDPGISVFQKTVANLFIQIGGAFFFALSVGWIVDRLQKKQGFSVLWQLSQEFRKAGVMGFYSDREDDAEKTLEEAIEKNHNGDVLIAGASLRYFVSVGGHLYGKINGMLTNEQNNVNFRVLYCKPEDNHELPVRSFVEDFSQDGIFPLKLDFDWNMTIIDTFKDFEKTFFKKYVFDSSSKTRVINDLESSRIGIEKLKSAIKEPNTISYREFSVAPYCTVVIFPDRVFYTPNLLCREVPVNMPMIVFHKSSDVYMKIEQYFKFLWLISSKPEPASEG
jgi:hypothetical protein